MTVKDIKNLPELCDDLELSQLVQIYCSDPKDLLVILGIVSDKLSSYHKRVRSARDIIKENAFYLDSYLSGKMYKGEPKGQYVRIQKNHAERILSVLGLLDNKRMEGEE